jgi:hypothetical protein
MMANCCTPFLSTIPSTMLEEAPLEDSADLAFLLCNAGQTYYAVSSLQK